MEEQMRMGRAGRGEDVPQWQQDLGQGGLVRRLLLARQWHGGGRGGEAAAALAPPTTVRAAGGGGRPIFFSGKTVFCPL